ncbi:MAG: leucine-rich repeat protein [Clostridia bacterium]|nr:leucine-rich repeat protein [Clostridia bacterium]
MRFCQNCGLKASDNGKFCEQCGAKLDRFCVNCGETLNGNAKFCSNCGTPVGGTNASSTQPVTPQNEDLFDFSAMEAGFDEQLAVQIEYDKRLALACSYAVRERYDDARAIYEKLLEENPNDMGAYMGFVRVETENYSVYEGVNIDKAIKVAEQMAHTKNLSDFDEGYAKYERDRREYFAKKESARKAEEARKEAEAARIAEEKRKIEERKLAEERRKAVEAARIAEERRKAAEAARIAEERRKAVEAARKAEEERKAAEVARIAEERRKAAEAARKAEEERKAAEVARKAEEERRIFYSVAVVAGGVLKEFYYPAWERVVIPNGITEIGKGAFTNGWLKGNRYIREVIIPDSVKKIRSEAFYGCKNLRSVVFGNGITEIGDSAFCGCENLTDIVIPNNVKKIGSDAFAFCSNLKTVVIGEGVKYIELYAFRQCESLIGVKILGGGSWYCCESGTTFDADVGFLPIEDEKLMALYLKDTYSFRRWIRYTF